MSLIPVQEVEEGDVLVLPRGREVTVERVDVYDDPINPMLDQYVVRWKAGSELGSFHPMLAGDIVVRAGRRLKIA